MSDTLVRASRLSRVFGSGQGTVIALAEATFEIHSGDRIALVGVSGSGKTTLLHLIAGLDQPSDGVIEWPALGQAGDLRPGPISIAFQGPSLLPPLTVEENVALPVLLAGGSQESALTASRTLLEAVGLADISAKLPEEISGGQAQRAGLARALAGEPTLVLADEPTGQLDRQTAAALMDLLLELVGRTGAALVVATHDMAVARALPLRWTMNQRRLETGAEQPCSL